MNLTDENYAAEQLSLFESMDNLQKEKQEKLETTMDKIEIDTAKAPSYQEAC